MHKMCSNSWFLEDAAAFYTNYAASKALERSRNGRPLKLVPFLWVA